jgi:FkbM family methyltransferase
MPKSSLRQLIKFIRVFGIIAGTRLWLGLLLKQLRFRSGLIAIKIPGLAAPIHLRRQDLQIFWQIMVMQENDFQSLPEASRELAFYKQILSEGNKPVIVDCGGHIGLSAVWFASRFPDALVYSVEPDTANFQMLQQNTRAYSNIVPIQGGIWSRSCLLHISNPNSGSASFRLQEVPESASPERAAVLQGYDLGDIVGREAANRLFLVKMDIEGAEAEVFRRPADWMNSAAVMIIELHDWLMPGQGTSRNLLARVSENHFDVHFRGENLILFRTAEQATIPPA